MIEKTAVSIESAVLVTGSSSGIGEAVASALLSEGWRVIGLDRQAGRVEHQSFELIQANLADPQVIAALPMRIETVSAWVHAAGLMHSARLGALEQSASEAMWRIHVEAAERLANRLLPAMAARGKGRIVLIGSRVAQGFPGRSQYAATKAALVSLARSWAAEVVSAGVTVNVVSPAATRTPMLGDPLRADSAPKPPPIGRFIEPSEVAALVSYLLSPPAAVITGQEIQICGGSSLPR